MPSCRSRRVPAALARFALAAASCALAVSALAATPIQVTSKTPTDGPIRYTVHVTSKQFGDASETRTLRSGDTDDFTWRTTPPGGAVAVAQGCPNAGALPLDANGAMVRQTQVRLAPIVAANGTANVQVNFRAQAPHGTRALTSGGKSITCPAVTSHTQIVRFSMPTDGTAKTIRLSDGTEITISARR